MMRLLFSLFLLVGSLEQAPPDAVVFETVAVVMDLGERSLAAYQFELHDAKGVAKIVGIEGGEHDAFIDPPFYDPAAIQHNRVILAAFSTLPQDQLPRGRTRIVTIHIQRPAQAVADYQIKLITAGTAEGLPIDVTLTLEIGSFSQ